MNAARFAAQIRRQHPNVTFYRVVVEDSDGNNVLSVKNADDEVLGRYGEGYGLDSVTIADLEEWASATASALQTQVESETSNNALTLLEELLSLVEPYKSTLVQNMASAERTSFARISAVCADLRKRLPN